MFEQPGVVLDATVTARTVVVRGLARKDANGAILSTKGFTINRGHRLGCSCHAMWCTRTHGRNISYVPLLSIIFPAPQALKSLNSCTSHDLRTKTNIPGNYEYRLTRLEWHVEYDTAPLLLMDTVETDVCLVVLEDARKNSVSSGREVACGHPRCIGIHHTFRIVYVPFETTQIKTRFRKRRRARTRGDMWHARVRVGVHEHYVHDPWADATVSAPD